MTVAELIQKLQAFPPNMEVMAADVDFGPCRIRSIAQTLVEDNGTQYNWEVAFPELERDEDDPERIQVVLIR